MKGNTFRREEFLCRSHFENGFYVQLNLNGVRHCWILYFCKILWLIKLSNPLISEYDIFKDHEPDVIVMATPHGINLSESIGVYASRVATGSAEWNRTWSEFKVSANINDEFSNELYHHLQVRV